MHLQVNANIYVFKKMIRYILFCSLLFESNSSSGDTEVPNQAESRVVADLVEEAAGNV